MCIPIRVVKCNHLLIIIIIIIDILTFNLLLCQKKNLVGVVSTSSKLRIATSPFVAKQHLVH
jgi:hypothetical protein